MKLRVAGLVSIIVLGFVACFLLPDSADPYLKLERGLRVQAPVSPAREIMKRARNTREIPVNADLVIHRVAPGSPRGPVDRLHQPWDWVDVYNRSARPVPMAGYSLSDDPDRMRKYRFPEIVLPPHSGCRIWLSGFHSMDSVWSLAPNDAVQAAGWKASRNDDVSDRFTYLLKGFRAPPPDAPPLDYALRFPIEINQSGRYAIWLHAGVDEGETSHVRVSFQGHKIQMHLAKRKSFEYVQVRCPTSADGYWDLAANAHALHCTVVNGFTLINKAVVMRWGEPFGQNAQDLHAGFKLRQSGEFIGLFDPRGVAVDHLVTPALVTGTMVTRDPEQHGRSRIESVASLGERGKTPVVTLGWPAGLVPSGTAVPVRCNEPGAVVRFTVDGSLPGVDSPRAGEQIMVYSNTTVRLRAFDESGHPGPITESSYWVDHSSALPILSLIAEPHQLYDSSWGMLMHPTMRGIRSERRCHATLIETNGQATAAVGGIRIQGRSSRAADWKRNFRLVFRERYGQPVWPGRMFEGPGPDQCRSVVAVGRNVIRNQLAHELMDLAELRSPRRRMARLFVNGAPYGLYLLVEDIQDPLYLQSVFGHLDLDVIKEKTFNPVKLGSRTMFDTELAPLVNREHPISYEGLSSLMDVPALCRWAAVIQLAGIMDSGQGYHVRNHRADGPPWSFMNWDLDNAFLASPVKGTTIPKGFRSRLVRDLGSTSPEFLQEVYLPSLQNVLNHIVPLARVPQRVRDLMVVCEPYLEEEFEAAINQQVFRSDVPDRQAYMKPRYHDLWEQLLGFADAFLAPGAREMGSRQFGGPIHDVRIEPEVPGAELSFDGWPARTGYVGRYFEGTELCVGWRDPDQARALEYVINGIPVRLTELRTNVTAAMTIHIREPGT